MLKISFILPVLNEAAHITEQLEALQGYRNLGHEVLVVDGGSQDASAELAAALSDQVLTCEPGRSRQMNQGAQAATGDLLVFLHTDTQLPAHADQLIVKALSSADGEWGWFAVRLSNPAFPYRIISACMNMRARLTFVATGDQTLFVTRELFARIGGFPDIELMEDVAICKLLRRKSTPNWVLRPVVTSSRRWERNGLMRTVGLMWWLRFLYFCGVSPVQLRRMYYPSAPASPSEPIVPTASDLKLDYIHDNACIAVFAREPVLGEVKTRLIPAIGPEAALALYLAMMDRTLQLVRQSGLCRMALWTSSNPAHEYFISHCNKKEICLQVEGDLGLKMADCAKQTLAQAGTDYVVIIGTDCPALTRDYLSAALAALQAGDDVVLGPAADGGYVLIGLRQPYPELFRDIAWGGPEVLAQTLAILKGMNLKVTLLPELWDVDTVEDLARLEALRPPLGWRPPG